MPDNLAEDLTPQKRLLIVEDEKEHLSFLTELFTLSGYLVTPAQNGVDAVEKLSNSTKQHRKHLDTNQRKCWASISTFSIPTAQRD